MNLTVPKRSLLAALSQCAGIAQKKGAMPILANVLLCATDEGLSASASDTYCSIRVVVPGAEITEAGTIAVSAQDLLDRTKALAEGPLNIRVADNHLTIKSGKRRFILPTMPGDEFPKLAERPTNAKRIEFRNGALAALLGRVHFSISADETRPMVNSALLEIDADGTRAVSTDGHRLTLATAEVEAAIPISLLVPLAAVTEIRKLATGDVTLSSNEQEMFLEMGTAVFSCKLTAAQFPPYKQVIPKDPPNKTTVSRSALADAIKAVSLASSDRTGGVKFSFASGMLTLTAESEKGQAEDEIAAEFVGAPGQVGFNAKYWLEALAAIPAEEVVIACGGELDPALVTGAGDSTLSATIMPMRGF